MKHLIIFLLLLFNLNIGFSQIGPGGVGNASSNGLWLKADDITQLNNTPVTTWIDASGNGNDANQISVGLKPSYFVTSSLNGMPIVRLDGADDEMAVADSPILDGTSGITFYAVVRPNNLNGSPRGILGKRITYPNPNEYAYTWFFYSSNRLYLDVSTSNNRFNTGTTTFSNATNYILSWDFDGTLAASQRSGMSNGSAQILRAPETSTVVLTSNQDLAIGALNVGYGTYLGADYAEIIHFNYALDTVDHILVQNYLSAKYDIPIANNDLYDKDDVANGDYDFDVAGIGQISATEINDDAQGSGIVRMLNPSGLDDNEFLIWGHDGGVQQATETTDIPAGIQARFDRVWRVSEVNSSQTAVDVGAIDIRFDLTGLGAITTSDLRLLVDTDNDGVFNDETPISGATALGSNIYLFAGVTAIANNLRFTIGTINISQTPLPIELINFNAQVMDNNVVKLDWQTASELDNDYFTIERSLNGIQWEELIEIDGAGNSSSLLTYDKYDTNPFLGVSYYRLKQTDFDGKFSYSQIKSVNINKLENSKTEIYPNPTDNQITIIGSESELKQVKIYNTLGQDVTMLTYYITNNNSKMVIDLSNLRPGMYYIKTKTTANKVYKQ